MFSKSLNIQLFSCFCWSCYFKILMVLLLMLLIMTLLMVLMLMIANDNDEE